jgi:hypothetical protein
MCLGSFVNAVDAALAYDQAAREYHRNKAKLNFPEPTPSQPQGASSQGPSTIPPPSLQHSHQQPQVTSSGAFPLCGQCGLPQLPLFSDEAAAVWTIDEKGTAETMRGETLTQAAGYQSSPSLAGTRTRRASSPPAHPDQGPQQAPVVMINDNKNSRRARDPTAEERACVGQVFVDPDDQELYLIQAVDYNEKFRTMVCSYQRLESGGGYDGYSPVGEVHISTVGEVWAWLGATPAHVRHDTRLYGEGKGEGEGLGVASAAVVSSPESVATAVPRPGPPTYKGPLPDKEGLWVRPTRKHATAGARYVGELCGELSSSGDAARQLLCNPSHHHHHNRHLHHQQPLSPPAWVVAASSGVRTAKGGRWEASVRVVGPKKVVEDYLGTFATQKEAARAYKDAAPPIIPTSKYRGEDKGDTAPHGTASTIELTASS